MHIDLNSCFATIEQQANPHLRGKPVAVAAYTTPRGCILAPSVEAKRYGVKTGMRVRDGKLLYPDLIVMPADPWKYRNVHFKLRRLLESYTPDISPKSIDEFVLDFKCFGIPKESEVQRAQSFSTLKTVSLKEVAQQDIKDVQSVPSFPILKIAKEIKQRIKSEIGEWLTVSIGVSTNRFLAKLASNLHKPDGLDEINKDNFKKVYLGLKLTDLPYIKLKNALRLGSVGIFSVLDFYNAPLWKLKAAFRSINGFYWFTRLRGWEIDDVSFARRSYGNSYALPKPLVSIFDLSPILTKLVTKTGFRLRSAGYLARGVHIAVSYRDGSFWHKAVKSEKDLFDSRDIYKKSLIILSSSPFTNVKPVRDMAISVYGLRKKDALQLDLFDDVGKKRKLTDAVDKVTRRWGDFVIAPGRIIAAADAVPDRVAFGQTEEIAQKAFPPGGMKELEEFTLS